MVITKGENLMAYSPHQLDPPETPPAFAVVCEGCEDVIHIDEAVNVGTDIKQYWLCEHNEKCAQWFAEDLLAELMAKGLR